MKLPENYSSWIEFAKDIKKYSPAKTVKVIEHGENIKDVAEYNIDSVKAKAFDEVMGSVKFSKNDIRNLTDVGLNGGYSFESIININDLLMKLTK